MQHELRGIYVAYRNLFARHRDEDSGRYADGRFESEADRCPEGHLDEQDCDRAEYRGAHDSFGGAQTAAQRIPPLRVQKSGAHYYASCARRKVCAP